MMWILRKIDSLIGTAIAAILGIAASQTHAFLAAYLQRLGGHLDEAKLAATRIQHGDFVAGLDPIVQSSLQAAADARVTALQSTYDVLSQADPLWRPFVFFREADPAIAKAAFANFQPALPLDAASLITALVGMVLGWMLYEIIKAPFRLAFKSRPRERRSAGRRHSAQLRRFSL